MQDLIDRLIGEFLDARPYLNSPRSAYDRCWYESEAFVNLLMEHGIDAELLSGFHLANCEAGRVITGAHTVARVGDVTYDWTVRQFINHHEDTVPRIISVDEFKKEWDQL